MKKLLVLAAVIAAFAGFYFGGGAEYLKPATYQALNETHPRSTAAIYFVAYVLIAALSIPGAAIMTLVGGAVFGLWKGLLLVSFASTIGATLAFLSSRLLLRDWVQQRFGNYLKKINEGIAKDGIFYLFSLRLIVGIPFFVINLVMGLTPIRTLSFYLASQIGMLPGTFVYVNAGAEIGKIDELSASGILRPGIVIALLALAALPFILKGVMGWIKSRRVYKPWAEQKPAKFDNNLLVIGAGAAGLVSSLIGAAVKAKVTLVEKAEMGGDCLNTGCVPSKALIRAAKARQEIVKAPALGISVNENTVEFPKVMQQVHSVIKAIEPHDSVERYEGLGVKVIKGEAEVLSPWTVRVNGEVHSARNIILATGAEPFVPPIDGLDQVDALTSDSLWNLKELPARLLVVGGGPIGCELAQAFSRLGSDVRVVDMADRLLPREDEDVSGFVRTLFDSEGISVNLRSKTTRFGRDETGQYAMLESADGEQRVYFDKALIAVGRKARTQGYGFDSLELETRRNGTLEVNEFMQTKYPNIYACGDVTGPFQFTHVAAHQAWYAAVNALFSPLKRFKADYRVIPWTTFIDPEVARVGLSETEAREQGIEVDVTHYGIDDLDRAIADNAATGFIKVLTAPGKDTILGVTIVGQKAGDIIAEYVLAMKHGLGLNKILGTIHIYPTMAEANKYVAGNWKRKNAPEKLLGWVAKFHAWRR